MMGLYMNEAFSTKHRALACAIITGFGRLGALLAPYVTNYMIYYGYYP